MSQILLSNEDWLAIEREACKRSLSYFIKRAWHVIEPAQPYVPGKPIDAIAEHLEAITSKQINRLYIACPPGCMKSLMVSVFFGAWEWGPLEMASNRYVCASHSLPLAIRDSVRARRLITSDWYQALWGHHVKLTNDQNDKIKYETTATGFRQSCAFTGLTGARGDRVLLDDPMSVDDAASEAKRANITQTFLEAVPTRLNNPIDSAIALIAQRLHDKDLIGVAEAKNLGYEGLVLPMEFERDRCCVTSIGFKDWRTEEGELLFPERFPRHVVDRDKIPLGSFGVASQFQQRPVPREGGMFQRAWFEIVNDAPVGIQWVRGWDLAATVATQGRDPAYTAGVKIGLAPNGVWYIGHVARGQLSAGKVENLIVNTASQDGYGTEVSLPQDPGQAGKAQISYLVSKLAGYKVHWSTESGSKEKRAEPVASQAEAGNIKIISGPWNEAFLNEVELFPNGSHVDQVDGMSRAFSRLVKPTVNDEFAAPMLINGDSNV
jgi:predicted phage terminase large subunit-like protein